MAAVDNAEDDWEYEYSATETETFYVDLDLSSVNGVIKSRNAGDRKSLKPPVNTTGDEGGAQPSSQPVKNGTEAEGNADHEGDDDPDDAEATHEPMSPQDAQNLPHAETLDSNPGSRLQILDLDTANPIVHYNGNTYSCTWHDMLGTTMFFAKHQEAPFHEPDISTEDYDLIGTSRIKLVGHKAKVVPKTASKKRPRDDVEDHNDNDNVNENENTAAPATDVQRAATVDDNLDRFVPAGRSLGTIKRTNPRTNMEIKRQANFLERLMEVKKARGETDTVRTFVDRHAATVNQRQAARRRQQQQSTTRTGAKGKEKAQTEERRRKTEIDELNRRVVKGDNAALERLQEIYAEMEEADADADTEEPEVTAGDVATATPISSTIEYNPIEQDQNPEQNDDIATPEEGQRL